MTFIVFEKLDQEEATHCYEQAMSFLRKNPRRKVIITDLFKIRKGHVAEDILNHCKPAVVLPPASEGK